MAMMPELPEVTLESARVDLARWAVSLRRAHAAGTGQARSHLAIRRTGAEDGAEDGAERAAYCCLGIWCEIERARGRVERHELSGFFSFAAPQEARNSSTLPKSIHLVDSDNPDLLHTVSRETHGEDLEASWGADCYDGPFSPSLEEWVADNADTYCAADLNDDLGLPFGRIADVVVWRYQLTPEELAAAEAAPRVELVEGPA
jgi:hypothetical protein